MRFKIFFDEKTNKLDINCLPDTNVDIILPENPSQHVYYPIPKDLSNVVHEYLLPLLDDEAAQEYAQITEDIKALTDRRREMINELRTLLNPKIIEKCEDFRIDHAEHFI